MSEHLHPTDVPQSPPSTAMVPQTAKVLRAELILSGDPARLRDGLQQLLLSSGWKTEWAPGGWSGVATRGNKVMNVLFGAFAQYHEMTFAFSSRPDGTTSLTCYRSGDGCMGGLWGMYKVKKSFEETTATVEHHFAQAGALVSSSGE